MSTPTLHATPRAVVAPPRRDLRRLWRVLLAVALPLGPLGVTIGRAIMPYWTSDDTATMVSKALANPGVMELGNWIVLVVTPALILSTLVLGYVARRGAPLLATVGAVISFLAYANLNAAGNADYLVGVLASVGLDQATIAAVVDAMYGTPIAFVSGFGWVVGHILGTVLLAIALLRARAVPRWAGWALAISQPVHFVSAVLVPSRALDVIGGWGLTTVGFLAVAAAILRTPNDEWDLPPRRRA